MCDTLVALGTATVDSKTIFGKNSDRPPNEAQYLDWIPARNYAEGEAVQCTYLSIPQVEHTHAVLLSRPYWMWGAEMGVNQHGLVIGNEAVYTKIPANKEPALLGMDLLRLALERAKTPPEAIEVITQLITTYGQGGNCAYGEKMYYHNSFLLANAAEAWVLETVDRQWAAYQVEDVYSISNVLTLDHAWNGNPNGSGDRALEKGLAAPEKGADLAREHSDFLYTTFSNARQRRQNTMNSLRRADLSIQAMFAALRDHGQNDGPNDSLLKNEVCMHAGFGPVRISQSTASLVAALNEHTLVFATGTSAPCTSIFKPFWTDIRLPEMGAKPGGVYDPQAFFWQHENLHREIMMDYPARIPVIQAEREQMEKRFVEGALALNHAPQAERSAYAASCFQEAATAEASWLEDIRKIPVKSTWLQRLHSSAWRRSSKKVKLELKAGRKG